MADPFGSSPPSSPPKTPEIKKPGSKLPIEHNTPISAKMASVMPHTSTHMQRHPTYTALRDEITGKVVGPMPVQGFLDEFLPRPKQSSTAKKPNSTHLQNIRTVENELQMYEAFIKAFQKPVASQLELFDSHAKGMEPLYGTVIKPDVCVIDDQSQRQAKVRLEDVGITVEMKYDESDDPFDDREHKKFERDTKQANDSLGQICAYATAHMAAQFRTHVFSLLIFPDYGRILRWDRAGVIVTAKIPFSGPMAALPLSEFFWRYAQASPIERGVDPNAKRLLPSEISSLPSNIRDSLHGTDAISFYRFTFPSRGQNEQDKTYIAAAPYYMGTVSPTGRATRSFKACCEDSGEEVFLKDTWRVLDGSLIAEHETYAKLKAAGVSHVATMAHYHDMEDHETQTASFLEFYNRGKPLANKFRRFRHYRFVLDQYAKPIERFKNVKELIQTFRDVLQAHREAHNDAKVLHRDISAGNIMIDKNNRGLLVDWDLSKSTDKRSIDGGGGRLPERTGTWQFIAYRLIQHRKEGEPYPEHNRDDDIESFWYVLYWLALRRCDHKVSDITVGQHIRASFDTKLETNGVHTAPIAKLNALRDSGLMDTIPFVSIPLSAILAEFQAVVAQRYKLDQEKISTIARLWQETLDEHKGKKTSSSELDDSYMYRLVKAKIRYDSAFARHLARHRWAEELLDRHLEPGKLIDPTNTIDVVLKVDWETGSKNVERKGLDTPAKVSEKRKTGFEDWNVDEPDAKRQRLNSSLVGIEEDLEEGKEEVVDEVEGEASEEEKEEVSEEEDGDGKMRTRP